MNCQYGFSVFVETFKQFHEIFSKIARGFDYTALEALYIHTS